MEAFLQVTEHRSVRDREPNDAAEEHHQVGLLRFRL
jgi:hypothetical protein